MRIEEAREHFLSYLEAERGYSPLTVSTYRSDIGQFMSHQGKARQVEGVRTCDLREFMVSLQARGLQASTIARRINCLRSFFKFLWTNDYMATNPCMKITTPKTPRKLPTVLTEDECRALLDSAYQCHYTMLGFRDRAVLSLLVYTGIRRQELLDITLDDIDLEQRWLRVRRGKGNKMRMVPLVPEAIEAVRDWLEFRTDCHHRCLFCTLTRKPLGRNGLHALFRKALRNAAICRPGITLHSLRHSFASLLLKNGCDLVSIKELLGHASLESTSIYLHVDIAALQEAVAKHPLRADD